MNCNDVKAGMQVETNPQLGSTDGMLVHQKHLDARGPKKRGRVLDWVPGHGGDVWAVDHEDGTCGVYSYEEFHPAGVVTVEDIRRWCANAKAIMPDFPSILAHLNENEGRYCGVSGYALCRIGELAEIYYRVEAALAEALSNSSDRNPNPNTGTQGGTENACLAQQEE